MDHVKLFVNRSRNVNIASDLAVTQGLGNPEQMQQIMGQMMNSPMMQNVMSDPEVLRNMLQGNPAIQQVGYASQLKHQL